MHILDFTYVNADFSTKAAAQQSNQPEYIPAPEVINQNDAFEYALSSAPNVLYAKYKQYGQVGQCYS